MRLDSLHQEREYPSCTRADILWSLDPKRCERLVKVRPLTHDEYKAGTTPAQVMMAAIHGLVKAMDAVGLTTSRNEMCAPLEKLACLPSPC